MHFSLRFYRVPMSALVGLTAVNSFWDTLHVECELLLSIITDNFGAYEYLNEYVFFAIPLDGTGDGYEFARPSGTWFIAYLSRHELSVMRSRLAKYRASTNERIDDSEVAFATLLEQGSKLLETERLLVLAVE